MLSTYLSLFIVGFQASASARHIAGAIPQALQERVPRPQGGWAYASAVCPTDLDQCGSAWCCPTSLTCVSVSDVDNICCPGSVDCISVFENSPYCADDSWSLWDQSTGGIVKSGYFCCKPGEVGLMTGFCIASNAITEGEVTALALLPGGQPSTAGGVTVMSTVTPSSPAATNAVTTAVVLTTATPGSGSSAASVTPASSATPVSSSAPIPVNSSPTTTPTAHSATAASVTPSSTSAAPSPTKSSGADSYKNSGSLWTVFTGFSLAYLFAL